MALICEWCKCNVDYDDAVRWRGHWFCSDKCKFEALAYCPPDDREVSMPIPQPTGEVADVRTCSGPTA